jgi:hypothetical protein
LKFFGSFLQKRTESQRFFLKKEAKTLYPQRRASLCGR